VNPPLFGRRERQLPQPVTRDQHLGRQALWPVERTLRAMSIFDEFTPPWLCEPAGRGVKVYLPPWRYLSGGERAMIVGAVSSRAGIENPTATWRTSGASPCVVITERPRVPDAVAWSRVTDMMRDASPSRPLVGLSANGRPVFADLEADSPHIAVSAGSGAGKSVLVRCLAAQTLYHGGGLVVLDFKRSSHRWCQGLPGVLYARDVADIHAALVAVGDEANRRNVASDTNPDVGPPLLVVAEEMNATIMKLTWYWEQARAKGDPKTSPAISALRDVLFMGRAVRVNAVAIAQQLSARSIGGGEARENFATRLLARATDNAWAMLAPQIRPLPPRSRTPGRWHLVVGDDCTEVQVPFGTDAEARLFAMSSPRCLMSQPVEISGPPVVEQLSHVPADATPVGLREAIPMLPGPPMSLAALRKASQRGGGFPAPVGRVNGTDVWELAALCGWRRERLAAQVVRTGEGTG
jgi:hypothetical protein